MVRILYLVMKMVVNAKQWADVIKHNPVAFGLETGFTDLTDIHNEWLKSFLYKEDDYTLQAHRGSYKTTTLAIAIALMIVIYPQQNIIFLRKAENDVIEIVTQVAKLLRSSFFQAMAKSIYGVPITLTKESAFEIDTNLKDSARGTSQLLGIGIGGSLTGKHADIVITDDIVNLKDRTSRKDRERTKTVYQELQNVKNRGGRIINTGTPWHKDDAFLLMPNIERFDCYSTGLIDEEELRELRDSMSSSLFSANYELRHISDEESMFKKPVIDSGLNTYKIYDGEAHIDASYTGKDYTAFTILKRQPDGKIYVYGDLREENVDDVLEEFEEKREELRAGTLHNETNADKGYLAKEIKEPVSTYHESMNKHIKISTYLKKEWKNIIFVGDTSRDYINQIIEYNENASHDDAPDSLASLLRETEVKKRKVLRRVKTYKTSL